MLKENLLPIDPEQLEVGDRVYTYRTCREFVFTGTSRYALNCQVEMAHFENVQPTDDAEAGQKWSLEMSVFLKQFGWFK